MSFQVRKMTWIPLCSEVATQKEKIAAEIFKIVKYVMAIMPWNNKEKKSLRNFTKVFVI